MDTGAVCFFVEIGVLEIFYTAYEKIYRIKCSRLTAKVWNALSL